MSASSDARSVFSVQYIRKMILELLGLSNVEQIHESKIRNFLIQLNFCCPGFDAGITAITVFCLVHFDTFSFRTFGRVAERLYADVIVFSCAHALFSLPSA